MNISEELQKFEKRYEIDKEYDMIKKYLETLDEMETQALLIAFNHLGTSFSIKKSIGFLEWKEKL